LRERAPESLGRKLRAIPTGTTAGHIGTTRWTATRSDFNNGRSLKLVAEARDGSDYISLNFYDLASGAQLAPCEMPHEKVISFIENYQPEQTR
jgi:hypothetical protein